MLGVKQEPLAVESPSLTKARLMPLGGLGQRLALRFECPVEHLPDVPAGLPDPYRAQQQP